MDSSLLLVIHINYLLLYTDSFFYLAGQHIHYGLTAPFFSQFTLEMVWSLEFHLEIHCMVYWRTVPNRTFFALWVQFVRLGPNHPHIK